MLGNGKGNWELGMGNWEYGFGWYRNNNFPKCGL